MHSRRIVFGAAETNYQHFPIEMCCLLSVNCACAWACACGSVRERESINKNDINVMCYVCVLHDKAKARQKTCEYFGARGVYYYYFSYMNAQIFNASIHAWVVRLTCARVSSSVDIPSV